VVCSSGCAENILRVVDPLGWVDPSVVVVVVVEDLHMCLPVWCRSDILAAGILAVDVLVVDILAVVVPRHNPLAVGTCRFACPTAVVQICRSAFPIASYYISLRKKTTCCA